MCFGNCNARIFIFDNISQLLPMERASKQREVMFVVCVSSAFKAFKGVVEEVRLRHKESCGRRGWEHMNNSIQLVKLSLHRKKKRPPKPVSAVSTAYTQSV